MMKAKLQTIRGSALLIALLLTGMLSLIAIMAIESSNTDIELSYSQSHLDAAFYNAEAGAKRAFVALNDNDDWRSGYADFGFGQGTFSVNLFDSLTTPSLADTVVIRSRGDVREAQAEVEMWTVPVYINPFVWAMFADSAITMDQTTCTDSYNSDSGAYAATVLQDEGSIGTNGRISTSKTVTIGGDAKTAVGGSITLGAGSQVLGDTSTTQDSVNIDIIPQSEYDWARTNSLAPLGLSGTGWSYNNGTRKLTMGSYSSVVLQSGVYYFSEIVMGQGSTISLAPGAQVRIYMSGNIDFNQNGRVNASGAPQNLQIYSQGNLFQLDQGNIFCGTFFGPNAHIQYDQTTQVYGALVGNSIKLDKGACFHYDRNLAKIRHGTTGEMIQVAWKEL